MIRLRHLLVGLKDPLLEGDALIERAASLAEQYGAVVRLVSVVERASGLLKLLLPASEESRLNNIVRQERSTQLEGLRLRLERRGILATAVVLEGRPFQELIREALREDIDFVLVNARQKERERPEFFGSTTLRLIRKCPCPVLALKPGSRGAFERILAAVDPLSEDAVNEGLNRSIVQHAASFAKQEQTTFRVVHAWDFYGKEAVSPALEPKVMKELAAGVLDVSRKALQNFVARLDVPLDEEQTVLLKGPAGEAIAEFARTEQADLLILGTVARTGIQGLLIGNTAENILRRVDCAVLTLKPEGFVSPVTVG